MWCLGCVKNIVFNVLRVVTVLLLIAHFILTILYVLPINPLRMKFERALAATIGTYFAQNWSLFAPNPIATTQALMARCLSADELPKTRNDQLPKDGWQDLSTPFFQQAQRHRISAYERLVRPQQNFLRAFLQGGQETQNWLVSCRKGNKESCLRSNQMLAAARVEASKHLRRIGSLFCRDAFPSQPFTHVALRFRERLSVPWSLRETAEPASKDHGLGIYEIEDTVAKMGLYTASVQ